MRFDAMQIDRELELQQTKEMLVRLGKKVDNVDKMDKSGREVCRLTGWMVDVLMGLLDDQTLDWLMY